MVKRVSLSVSGSTAVQYAWATYSQTVQKVATTALDGTVFYQTVGGVVSRVKIEGIVTAAERSSIEVAERNGNRVSCVFNGSEIYGGMLTDLSFEDEHRGLYEKFTAELVVTP